MHDKRKPLVAGNWKLHGTLGEAKNLATSVKSKLAAARDVDVVLAPVFTALTTVRDALAGSTLGLSAQDVYWEPKGAYTGEVSAAMIKDAGCGYCIVGHSERRQYFGETDETVGRKVLALVAQGLAPIVCVGENLEERERGQASSVVLGQLEGAFRGLSEVDAADIVIAYEPIWAIGTGRTASPEDALEIHEIIRQWLGQRYSQALALRCRILYGGSVKPANAGELLSQPDIDGALVGGASLDADSFAAIVAAAGASQS